MAAYADIVEKVSQLSILGAELVNEIAVLEANRDALEQRFDADLSRLNQAISQLPAVVNVLQLDEPPTRRLSALGSLRVAVRSTIFRLERRDSPLDEVHTVIADIFHVDTDMRASQKEASEKKIATADIACKAAEHAALCSSVGRTVSEAQNRTQASLLAANTGITRAQREIAGNNSTVAEMENKGREHDGNAAGAGFFFIATAWIPIVNLVTIPVSLMSMNESKKLAESCRATAASLTAEIATKSAEKVALETTRFQLNTALQSLSLAQSLAERRARDAKGLRDQARSLTDKYGIVTTRLRDVVRALDMLRVGAEISAESWAQERVLGLVAIKGMLGTLREQGMLQPEGEQVLGMLEVVKGLQEKGGGRLELEELEL
ncbi:hypothetical protein QBC39DRAFT_384137 [Podospora conica]|nr:hypothetical protein QBC39DRAFT_384137 [Schizothecium conicum]